MIRRIPKHFTIDRQLNRQFKLRCAQLEVKQNEVIEVAIENFINGSEKNLIISRRQQLQESGLKGRSRLSALAEPHTLEGGEVLCTVSSQCNLQSALQ